MKHGCTAATPATSPVNSEVPGRPDEERLPGDRSMVFLSRAEYQQWHAPDVRARILAFIRQAGLAERTMPVGSMNGLMLDVWLGHLQRWQSEQVNGIKNQTGARR